MAEVGNGQQHSTQSVELRVSATLENLAVLRTLVAAIGTFELTYVANQIGEAKAEAVTLLIAAGVGYVALLLPSAWVISVLERRYAIKR